MMQSIFKEIIRIDLKWEMVRDAGTIQGQEGQCKHEGQSVENSWPRPFDRISFEAYSNSRLVTCGNICAYLPLELIANSTFATIIFTLKGHVCPPLPPLRKGKGGACLSAPPLSGVPGNGEYIIN